MCSHTAFAPTLDRITAPFERQDCDKPITAYIHTSFEQYYGTPLTHLSKVLKRHRLLRVWGRKFALDARTGLPPHMDEVGGRCVMHGEEREWVVSG